MRKALVQVNSQPDGKRGKIGKEKNDVFLFFMIAILCEIARRTDIEGGNPHKHNTKRNKTS